MKKTVLLMSSLLMVGVIILSSCSTPPAASPMIDTDTPAVPTATKVVSTSIPTPTPTEEPILPCNITFDSDRDGNSEVYSMAPDGSNQVNLTNNPGEDSDPVLSPDGSQIAFVSNRVTDTGGGQFIYTMLADGSNVAQISHQDESKSPDWSPSGSQIAYSDKGDIYLVDISKGTEVNLTNSPEQDRDPKISPDGQQIAWLKGENNNSQLYVMNLDGSNALQLTNDGQVYGAEWAVDGRILANWDNPDGFCHNCVITADGTNVTDAGGKGSIQQFRPLWTAEGDRVEMGSGDINGTGHEDIFLVGEIYPDLFKFLTGDAGNNRSPDTASNCGPTHGVYPRYGSGVVDTLPTDSTTQTNRSFTIGYTGNLDAQTQSDIDKACSELEVQCIKGENISDLANQGVDAIVNASNQWDVMGSSPALHDAVERGIPVFELNAETDEPGAYNLSAEHEIYTITLNWIFQQMGGQGDFVYYNFGNSDYIQNQVDAVLKDYPGITAIKNAADYNGNSFTQQDIVNLIAKDPNLGGIWSTGQINDIFWAINDKSASHMPVTECMVRKDELIDWKNLIDAGSTFQCIAQIRPGGTAYEGVYVAYYYLSGLKFKPDAFFAGSKNTLKYDIPVITNESLPEWIGPKLDPMRVGENELLQLPPMTPEEIKAKWFIG